MLSCESDFSDESDLGPLARDQVADAFAYISAEQPSAALRWFDAIVDRTGSLSTLPDIGRIMPEAGRPEVREAFVEPYRLIYRRDPDPGDTSYSIWDTRH